MQRIATATKYVDLFGAGKHGFGESPLIPLTTYLSAAWFNSIQEEVAKALEYQGVTLDPDDDTQLYTTIDSWKFFGLPTLESGAVLEVKSGAEVGVASGAIFTFGNLPEFTNGVVFSTGGTVQLNSAVTLLVQGDASFTKTSTDVPFAGGIEIGAGKKITGADVNTTIEGFGTIEAAVLQTTTLGKVSTRRVEFPAGVAGAANQLVQDTSGGLDWDNGSKVHTSAYGYLAPAYGYLAGTVTVDNSIDDTGLDVTISLRPNQTARIEAHLLVGVEFDTADVNLRIQVVDSGASGDHTIGPTDVVPCAEAAGKFYNGVRCFHWKPSDSFGAPDDPDDYTFRVRFGRNGGSAGDEVYAKMVSLAVVAIDGG